MRSAFMSAMVCFRGHPGPEGGFRRYAEHDVETLAFVRRCRDWDSSSAKPRTMRLRGNRLQPCAPVLRRCSKAGRCTAEACRLHRLEDDFAWPCAAATKRCASDRHVRSYDKETREPRANVKVEVLYGRMPVTCRAVRRSKTSWPQKRRAEVQEYSSVTKNGQRTQVPGLSTIESWKECRRRDTEDQSFALSAVVSGSKEVGLPAAELIHRALVEARQGKQDEARTGCPLP